MKSPVAETVETVYAALLDAELAKVMMSPGWKLENGVPDDEIVPVVVKFRVPSPSAVKAVVRATTLSPSAAVSPSVKV